MSNRQKINDLKDVIRNPFCFPGGYSKLGLLSDGATLCPACCKAEFRQIVRDTKDAHYNSGWGFEAVYVYWEGPDTYCAHCNKILVSEYGDPEENS